MKESPWLFLFTSKLFSRVGFIGSHALVTSLVRVSNFVTVWITFFPGPWLCWWSRGWSTYSNRSLLDSLFTGVLHCHSSFILRIQHWKIYNKNIDYLQSIWTCLASSSSRSWWWWWIYPAEYSRIKTSMEMMFDNRIRYTWLRILQRNVEQETVSEKVPKPSNWKSWLITASNKLYML